MKNEKSDEKVGPGSMRLPSARRQIQAHKGETNRFLKKTTVRAADRLETERSHFPALIRKQMEASNGTSKTEWNKSQRRLCIDLLSLFLGELFLSHNGNLPRKPLHIRNLFNKII